MRVSDGETIERHNDSFIAYGILMERGSCNIGRSESKYCEFKHCRQFREYWKYSAVQVFASQ